MGIFHSLQIRHQELYLYATLWGKKRVFLGGGGANHKSASYWKNAKFSWRTDKMAVLDHRIGARCAPALVAWVSGPINEFDLP